MSPSDNRSSSHHPSLSPDPKQPDEFRTIANPGQPREPWHPRRWPRIRHAHPLGAAVVRVMQRSQAEMRPHPPRLPSLRSSRPPLRVPRREKVQQGQAEAGPQARGQVVYVLGSRRVWWPLPVPVTHHHDSHPVQLESQIRVIGSNDANGQRVVITPSTPAPVVPDAAAPSPAGWSEPQATPQHLEPTAPRSHVQPNLSGAGVRPPAVPGEGIRHPSTDWLTNSDLESIRSQPVSSELRQELLVSTLS